MKFQNLPQPAPNPEIPASGLLRAAAVIAASAMPPPAYLGTGASEAGGGAAAAPASGPARGLPAGGSLLALVGAVIPGAAAAPLAVKADPSAKISRAALLAARPAAPVPAGRPAACAFAPRGGPLQSLPAGAAPAITTIVRGPPAALPLSPTGPGTRAAQARPGAAPLRPAISIIAMPQEKGGGEGTHA